MDKLQLQLIKRLIMDDGWDALMVARDEYIAKNSIESITGNSEFETLRELHKKQGKIEGLKEFFEDLERNNI